MPKIKLKFLFYLFLILLLSACSSTHRRYKYRHDFAPNFHVDPSKIQDAVPKSEPLSKHANPHSYVVLGQRYYVLKSAKGYDQTGIASWYGMKFHDHKTSNGDNYDVTKMTGASKVLPIPCYVRVINLNNGKNIIVRINDRGPFHPNRIIDLSYAAAYKLNMLQKGTALVEVKSIDASSTSTIPIGHPHIYIQLGAFTVRNNAELLKIKLIKLTPYTVTINTAIINNQTFYRVQIGPLPNVDSTDNLHAIIQQLQLGNPLTVIK